MSVSELECFIADLPKLKLHLSFEGALPFIAKLIQRKKITPPQGNLRTHLIKTNYPDFGDFADGLLLNARWITSIRSRLLLRRQVAAQCTVPPQLVVLATGTE